MKYVWNMVATLLFILALVYLAGMIWTAIGGQSVPAGVRWFYPWLPNA